MYEDEIDIAQTFRTPSTCRCMYCLQLTHVMHKSEALIGPDKMQEHGRNNGHETDGTTDSQLYRYVDLSVDVDCHMMPCNAITVIEAKRT